MGNAGCQLRAGVGLSKLAVVKTVASSLDDWCPVPSLLLLSEYGNCPFPHAPQIFQAPQTHRPGSGLSRPRCPGMV